jgi:hypothetical protein
MPSARAKYFALDSIILEECRRTTAPGTKASTAPTEWTTMLTFSGERIAASTPIPGRR